MTKWTIEETKLAKDLLQKGSTYKDIAKILNKTNKAIKLRMNRMGLTYKQFNPKEKVIKFCECCGDRIKNSGIRFCSSSCAAKTNNVLYPKRTPIDEEASKSQNKRIRLPKNVNKCLCCGENCYQVYCDNICHKNHKNDILIENWKNGIDLGYTGETKQLKTFIKRYLHEKANYKCSKCGWDEIHTITNKCPLEVNHIDGDAENCKEENLEVICPNCHSLTTNFRNLNSNSKRNRK